MLNRRLDKINSARGYDRVTLFLGRINPLFRYIFEQKGFSNAPRPSVLKLTWYTYTDMVLR